MKDIILFLASLFLILCGFMFTYVLWVTNKVFQSYLLMIFYYISVYIYFIRLYQIREG